MMHPEARCGMMYFTQFGEAARRFSFLIFMEEMNGEIWPNRGGRI